MTEDPGRDCRSSFKYFSIIGIDWKVLLPIPLSQLAIDLKHAGLDPFYVFKAQLVLLKLAQFACFLLARGHIREEGDEGFNENLSLPETHSSLEYLKRWEYEMVWRRWVARLLLSSCSQLFVRDCIWMVACNYTQGRCYDTLLFFCVKRRGWETAMFELKSSWHRTVWPSSAHMRNLSRENVKGWRLLCLLLRCKQPVRSLLLFSFNYADLHLFHLNEWVLIKHEHCYKSQLQRGGKKKLQKSLFSLSVSKCRNSPLMQIPISQQRCNVHKCHTTGGSNAGLMHRGGEGGGGSSLWWEKGRR